jgi:hypothetical protein
LDVLLTVKLFGFSLENPIHIITDPNTYTSYNNNSTTTTPLPTTTQQQQQQQQEIQQQIQQQQTNSTTNKQYGMDNTSSTSIEKIGIICVC